MLFSRVRNFLLFVTKGSLVTSPRHPGIGVTILPCTGDSRFDKSKHDQCIQPKLAKIKQLFQFVFCAPGTVQGPLWRLRYILTTILGAGYSFLAYSRAVFSTRGDVAPPGHV